MVSIGGYGSLDAVMELHRRDGICNITIAARLGGSMVPCASSS